MKKRLCHRGAVYPTFNCVELWTIEIPIVEICFKFQDCFYRLDFKIKPDFSVHPFRFPTIHFLMQIDAWCNLHFRNCWTFLLLMCSGRILCMAIKQKWKFRNFFNFVVRVVSCTCVLSDAYVTRSIVRIQLVGCSLIYVVQCNLLSGNFGSAQYSIKLNFYWKLISGRIIISFRYIHKECPHLGGGV